jgi:hypothetical protein
VGSFWTYESRRCQGFAFSAIGDYLPARTPARPRRAIIYVGVLMFIRSGKVRCGERFNQFVNKLTILKVKPNSYDLLNAMQYTTVLNL